MKILEKIKEIFKNMGKKTPKTLAAGAAIVTVGLSAGSATNKDVVVDKNVKVEQENDFKNSLKALPGVLGKEINEKMEQNFIETEVNQIIDIDTLLRFVKNLFIEDYEKKTGDTSLSTENIEIWEKTQDRVYVDAETGLMITHGDDPALTMQKLEEHGVSYDEEENVKIYEIKKKDGEVIDCGALVDEKLEKAILGKDLFTDKEYAGILTTEKLGRIVPIVFECRKFMEEESELGVTRTKNEMIKILKEYVYEYKNENQEKVTEIDDGMGIG